ncbi:creatininase family protein [Ensifer sp. 1H6]|uniref:creatininase family protein n=1 Tax=Ensifer sp. 1H6 TaxID=1911585 RepID=UPI001FD88526|nr:creatininase family protein [Ensifer sp. 1H6]
MPIVATTPWMLAPEESGKIFEVGAHHACEGEASIMLAIVPDAVKTEMFSQAYGNQQHPVDVPADVSRFYSFAERAPVTGTWGDPRSARAVVDPARARIDELAGVFPLRPQAL